MAAYKPVEPANVSAPTPLSRAPSTTAAIAKLRKRGRKRNSLGVEDEVVDCGAVIERDRLEEYPEPPGQ
ncbi:MAG: hypothetical protein Tsb0020_17710 [Haliangiales bacterium]